MSALSNVISTAIEGNINRAVRRALPSPAGAILAPAIDKAIDQVRGAVLGRQPDKKFQEAPRFTGASNSPGDSFAGIHARGDALQNWCWYALMPSLQNNGYNNDLAWYYIQTANLPERTINVDSVNFGGHPVHFPESYSVDPLQLGLFMDNRNESSRYIQAWRELVLQNGDPNISDSNKGMWGLPAKYKKNIDIVVLNTEKMIALNLKYTRCWPTVSTNTELTSGQGEAMIKTVSFVAEDVYVSVFDAQGIVEPSKEADQSGYTTGLSGGLVSSVLNKIGGISTAFL